MTICCEALVNRVLQAAPDVTTWSLWGLNTKAGVAPLAPLRGRSVAWQSHPAYTPPSSDGTAEPDAAVLPEADDAGCCPA